ncbi:zinc finger and BTB domain-containing protein 14-like isoform X2 [Hyposmocoma kahamanoa]|uniref:zinc finger and BTB domain-containing protein 14-like isoform X2 n=1 Tax=Hyposmocoma kahamanoa TaxID=1477025 RepID=UPI000E6D6111|nr:zinc finger and BTB domain-containing protein 14-like isoform X2 [Hyposmocoma kahamanoa]
MCDMQKMPTREDASCDEDSDMNFTAFQAVGATGTHFVTTTGQVPVAKIQQNVAANGATIQQVVGMVGEGMQYMQQPQVISVPIALPGAKPGDPQPTVQIQVLNPNLLQQQQQPKYQMQIPIQGFQQGGAVLTVAYSPEANDGSGIQLLGNTLPEGTFRMRTGLQVLAAMPQEMQLLQPSQAQTQDKDQPQQIQHQVFITPNQQIVINSLDDNKLNNNTSSNNNNVGVANIVIKEECDDNLNDDESSQGTETSDSMSWQTTSSSHADLVKYLNTLPPQQAQALPASLQQFLRLNPEGKKVDQIEIEVASIDMDDDRKEPIAEAVIEEDGSVKIQSKKKKKYKKKPPKPARPKPGQVVIAQASDGTPIFCCPECQMAYPEKEQLEMHLIVHKIERRFICGICGAGLKRKEHLERHKLGHNPDRPYVCGVCRKGFKRREHLTLHTVIHSGVKTELCGECGKGFYRKDHLRKHTRSHETKRARDEAQGVTATDIDIKPAMSANNTIMPEITIHMPTSANMQVPVQINIPQHMVSSLQAAQASSDAQTQLDALLAQHS